MEEEKFKKILKEIKSRDKRDAQIDKANRVSLKTTGLKEQKPKKSIEVNTGKLIGVSNVVKFIKEKLSDKDKIISITGMSGTGKSTTAERLKKELGAVKFSMGEIFRYLTYLKIKNTKSEIDFKEIIKNMHYKMETDGLNLFDGNLNITKSLKKELRLAEIDIGVPKTASITQELVLSFMAKEISQLTKQTSKRIIMEGREFTLDFIPSDLRINLVADACTRAKRRTAQYH